ncbi:MAG: histidine kinase, partial [Bacteroidota bacterium]
MRLSFSLFQYLNIATHILIWGTVIYLFLPEYGMGIFQTAFYEGMEEIPFFIYSTILNVILFYLISHGVVPYSLRINSFNFFLLANITVYFSFVAFECGLDYLYQWFVYSKQRNPSVWESGGLSYFGWWTGNLTFTAVMLALSNFYGYTYAWFTGERDRQMLKEEKLKAELLALKHQINPHFLFNILNGLYGLAFKNNDEQTASGIAKLSQLMRYML